MSDDVEDKKIHAAAKSTSVPSRKPGDGDLTCSESQIEDILSEGESSKPMSKSDKGLYAKRPLKPARKTTSGVSEVTPVLVRPDES